MLDHFAKEKSDFLGKKDKSKKGSIDKGVKGIVDLINSKKDYYTTSSCAGRIVLLEKKSKRKNECNWLFTKHDKVKFNEIRRALEIYNKNKTKSQVWFKQQPLILHVACRDIEKAKHLLGLSRKIFKHSGILSINEKKAVVEIIGNERIETVVADRNFAADENYIKNLVKYANKNFDENKGKSERFFELVKKI